MINKFKKMKLKITENNNASLNICVSLFKKGNKSMIGCPGSIMYEVCYMFDSVMNQGMIWVKFDCCVNELTKALTFCCSLSSVGLESTRKKRIPKYYKPGVMGIEMTSFS